MIRPQLYLPLIIISCFTLGTLSGQQTEIILQKGHESSPVVSATIGSDNQMMATIDYAGKVIIWDIATGLQLDEVQTHIKGNSLIEFDPSSERKLWVDNQRNQLLILDFATRTASIRFVGKSVQCLNETKNNNSVVTQAEFVDPCGKVEMIGRRAAGGGQYIFTTDLNELYICELNRERYRYRFDDLADLNLINFSNDVIVSAPASKTTKPSKSAPSKSSKSRPSKSTKAPPSKISKVAPAPRRPAQASGNPNNAVKIHPGFLEDYGYRRSFGKMPDALVYNKATRRMAFQNPTNKQLTLLDDNKRPIKVIDNPLDPAAKSWLSPTADYAGLAHENQFLWIKLEDGIRLTMTTQSDQPIKQLEVYPDQHTVLIIRLNNQLELYDFEQQKLLFQRQFQENIRGLTLSKDGSYLLTAHGKKGVYLWNINFKTLERIFSATIPEIVEIQITAKEDQLFTLSENKELFSLQLGETFAFRNILPAEESLKRAVFSPDGQTLLWTNAKKNQELFVHHQGENLSILFPTDFVIDQLFFSPKGDQFAVSSRSGAVEVYHTEAMQSIAKFPPLGARINQLSMHPEKPLMAVAIKDRIILADWENGPSQNWSIKDEAAPEVLFSVDKSAGNHDAGDLIYTEFSQTGKCMILRGGPQAGILELGENDELTRLFPDKTTNFPGIFASGLINKAFTSSIYSPIFMDKDEKILFEGKGKEVIEIWDFKTISKDLIQYNGERRRFRAKPRYTVDTKDIPYRSFVVMQTQPIIIFNCGNQGLKLVNFEKNELLVTIYPVNEQKMLLINPALQYYTTSRGYDMLAFKRGDKVYPLEQFDLQFNRPDKVLKGIGLTSDSLVTAYYRAYQKRLSKLEFTEDMISESADLPQIEILTTNIPTSTTEANLQFQVRASDQKERLDRLRVYVNDVPVFGRKGIKLRRKNTLVHEQQIELSLSKGLNKVQASVLNRAGAESLKETFYITLENPAQQPDLYFIGIGVAEYANTEKNLKYPVKDVEDLAVFFSKDSNNYDQVHVHLLKDKAVTLENLQTLKDILMKTDINDRVVLFYAGHGLLDSDLNYYLAAHDVQFENPKIKGIPYEVFENLLDSIPSRFKLSLMDACHSGEIDKESVKKLESNPSREEGVLFRSTGVSLGNNRVGLENSFELMKEIFVDLRRITGATVISSASGVEFAIEGEKWDNSVFTYCLLKGLAEMEADLDKDGSIMISELQQYLAQEVSRITNGGQRPTMRIENIANDWRVW